MSKPKFKLGATVYTLMGLPESVIKGVVVTVSKRILTTATRDAFNYVLRVEMRGYKPRSITLGEEGLMTLEEATAWKLRDQ